MTTRKGNSSERKTGPDGATGRLVELDVTRGLALAMILVSNIQEFGLPRAGYFYPSVFGDFSLPNRLVWHLDHLFFNGKSLFLFGLVFGASLEMAARKVRTEGGPLWKAHARRLCWLFVIGMVHAYLVWDGDILVTLALCGCAVLLLRRLPLSRVFATALVFWGAAPWVLATLNRYAGILDLEACAHFGGPLTGPPGTMQTILEALRGGLADQLVYRVPAAYTLQTTVLPLYLFWFVGASMLLGIGLLRQGFLTGRSSARTYRTVLLGGIPGLVLIHWEFHRSLAAILSPWAGLTLSAQYEWATDLIVGLALVSGVFIIVDSRRFFRPVAWFAAYGRMSLSNYIGQSLICTFLFYGHGLGWFGRVERVSLLGITILVVVLQMAMTVIWLRRFRRGPLEALTRRG